MGRNCLIGYYSSKYWVVKPIVLLLHDRIIMNEPAFIGAVDDYSSTYSMLCSDVLKELKKKKLVDIVNYDKLLPEERKKQVDYAVNQCMGKVDTGNLLYISYNNWHEHRKWIFNKFPFSKQEKSDIKKEIINLKNKVNYYKERGPIEKVDEEILKRYFEEVFITLSVSEIKKEPFYDWWGYAPYYDMVLKSSSTSHKHLMDLSALDISFDISFDLYVPSFIVKDIDSIDKFIELRNDYRLPKLRNEISKISDKVMKLKHMDILEGEDSIERMRQEILYKLFYVQKEIEEDTVNTTKKFDVITTIASLFIDFLGFKGLFIPSSLLKFLDMRKKSLIQKNYGEERLSWYFYLQDLRKICSEKTFKTRLREVKDSIYKRKDSDGKTMIDKSWLNELESSWSGE